MIKSKYKYKVSTHFRKHPTSEWEPESPDNRYFKSLKTAKAKAILYLSIWHSLSGIAYKADIHRKDKKGKYTIKVTTIRR